MGIPIKMPPFSGATVAGSRLCIGFALLLLTTNIQAAVLYTFTGTTLPFPGHPAISQAFSYIAADFVTPPAPVLSTQLNSCTNCIPPPDPAIVFLQNFSIPNVDVVQFNEPGGAADYYYFPLGAFSLPGTYNTMPGNTGQLTVQVIPEPSIFSTLLIGLIGLITVGWWRDRHARTRLHTM